MATRSRRVKYSDPEFEARLAEIREQLLIDTARLRLRRAGIVDNPHALNREISRLRVIFLKYCV